MTSVDAPVVKSRGLSNGTIAIIVVVCCIIIFISVYLGVHFYAKKTREDAKDPPPGPGGTILTIVPIELSKYLGTWYEIARLPNEFEDFGDTSCSMVTAEYGAIVGDVDTITVKNTCQVRSGVAPSLASSVITSNGGLATTTTTTSSPSDVNVNAGTIISPGEAEVNSNGTLSVTFSPKYLPPFYGNYTCIYRQLGAAADDPWKTSVVVGGGTEGVIYAWILSRTPTMLLEDKALALAALVTAGVDVTKLVLSEPA